MSSKEPTCYKPKKHYTDSELALYTWVDWWITLICAVRDDMGADHIQECRRNIRLYEEGIDQ
jgi:hypothetical protein